MFVGHSRLETSTTRPASIRTMTLLDLVSELVDAGGSDREVVMEVMDLVETGRVCLIGQVREADLLASA